jgi:hypothetical protein
MLTTPDILRLAHLYGAAKGVALSTIGKRACGNHKIFRRLAQGTGANIHTIERIERFFRDTWPQDAAWPADIVPGPERAAAE